MASRLVFFFTTTSPPLEDVTVPPEVVDVPAEPDEARRVVVERRVVERVGVRAVVRGAATAPAAPAAPPATSPASIESS
jgi:hypothetical protein